MFRAVRLCSAAMSVRHPNAERIERWFAAFRAGDVAAISAALADDVVWRFPGRRGALAGEHRGRDAVFSFLANVMQLSQGTFHLELETVLADDDHAVALFRGHGRRGAKTLNNPTCLRMKLDGGRVVDVWEFVWDLYDVDEFWA